MRFPRASARWAIVAACLVAALPAGAGSLEVGPTTVLFAKPGATAVLYVNNYGSEPATVQIEPFDWSEPDGSDRLTPSDTLMASPPMATIPPQGKQTVRLKVVPRGASGEESFRLLVSELPDPLRARNHSVQVLTQFSVPAFAAVSSPESVALQWSAAAQRDGLELTARNAGTHHVKLQGVDIAGPGLAGRTLPSALNYILAGSYRIWKIPCQGCAAGDRLHIKGSDLASGATFDDSIVVGQ